jgi:hypothetical protein
MNYLQLFFEGLIGDLDVLETICHGAEQIAVRSWKIGSWSHGRHVLIFAYLFLALD